MPSSKGPSGERWDFRPTPDEMNRISEIFANDFKIPKNFRQTAAACISEYDDPREEVYYRFALARIFAPCFFFLVTFIS